MGIVEQPADRRWTQHFEQLVLLTAEDKHENYTGCLSRCWQRPFCSPVPELWWRISASARPAPQPSPSCRTEYTTVWDTEYVESVEDVCETVYVDQCQTLQRQVCTPTVRKECTTTQERQCTTKYEEVCRTEYVTEYETYTDTECTTEYVTEYEKYTDRECKTEYKTEWETYQETECTTEYKRDCEFHWEGSGYDKKWVEDPATCKNNPYDTCN